jgi:hypothetical protein
MPDGGVQYSSKGGGGRPAISAAAIACLFNAGEYDDTHVPRMLDYAEKHLGNIANNGFGHWHYAHFYYAQVMYREGGKKWEKYRKQIEERLGAPLPVPGEELPEEIEIQLARLVAEAGKQLAQEHTQQAAQQQAQQQAQDPMFQLQQGELKVKQAEVARKQAKDQADLQLDEQKLALDRERLQMEAQRNANQTSSQSQQAQQKMRLDVMKHVTQQPPNLGGPPQG